MKCARCGEDITAPYFYQGKPYGYTCIKIINPTVKKKKASIDECWVIADISTLVSDYKKQEVTAFWNGRKFKFWAFPVKDHLGKEILSSLNYNIEIGISNEIFINVAAYKFYYESKKGE